MKLHSYFSFCYLENVLKDRLSKTSGGNFTDGFSGPKSFRYFRETGPRVAPAWKTCKGNLSFKECFYAIKPRNLKTIRDARQCTFGICSFTTVLKIKLQRNMSHANSILWDTFQQKSNTKIKKLKKIGVWPMDPV